MSLDQNALLRSEIVVNPYPFYHRLRSQDPVHWSELWGGWVLTRYADVVSALQDQRLSSARSNLVMGQLPAAMRDGMGPLQGYMSMSIGFSDPPDHTRRRAVIKGVLTPRVFEAMRPHIQDLVDNLLDAVEGSGRMDVIRDFAYPLPITVICEMLGVPPEDRAQFKTMVDDLVALMGIGRVLPGTAERAQQSVVELSGYFSRIVAQHRGSPNGNLMGALVAGLDQGHLLSEEELIVNCIALFMGGHETTRSLIGNGLLALLQNPDQLGKLRDDPSLIVTAVEELLRYNSPLQRAVRVAKEDLEIGGKQIQQGQLVLAMLGAANRDPEQFPDPDRLDITRQENRHVAFGHGTRFCLGAPLARIEGQIAINTVLRRMPRLRLASEALEWEDNMAFRCLKSLPVLA